MNSFRNSREFSLYRQMVFGSRAGASHQGSAFAVPAFSTDDAAAQSAAHAVAEIDASVPAETETK